MENIFSEASIKKTKGREFIMKIIKSSNLPISAEDIYNICLKNNKKINLSTIYRTLNTLEKKKILIKQIRQNGTTYFQENKHDHKHLFVCLNCGKTIVLDNCPLQDALDSISKKRDFEITSHNIELYGTCKNCKKNKKI